MIILFLVTVYIKSSIDYEFEYKHIILFRHISIIQKTMIDRLP